MRDVEERAEAVLAALPGYVWDGERLPVPVEDIADSGFGLLVRDVEDMRAAPGAPRARTRASRCRACCCPRAARSGSTPTRRASGRRGGASRSGTSSATGSCTAPASRRCSAAARTVDEPGARPERDIEEEASAFAAALLMPQWLFVREHARCDGDVAALCATFGSSIAATERRIASLF